MKRRGTVGHTRISGQKLAFAAHRLLFDFDGPQKLVRGVVNIDDDDDDGSAELSASWSQHLGVKPMQIVPLFLFSRGHDMRRYNWYVLCGGCGVCVRP
jgi:hypothetical protein